MPTRTDTVSADLLDWSDEMDSESQLPQYEPQMKTFWADRDARTRHSAEVVIGRLLEVFRPESAVDLGCGVGTWLSVLGERGVSDVVGVEGGEVDDHLIQIPIDQFFRADLGQPLSLGRRFDLAISLEVAEHLPASSAPTFVRSLVEHASVVLFSAAIPGQGGLHHVNEQWPRYWIDLFAEHGYVPLDAIRPSIWDDDDIILCYRQNVLVFARHDVLDTEPALLAAYESTSPGFLDVVHPAMLDEMRRRAEQAVAETPLGLLGQMPGALARSVRYRVGKRRSADAR